VTLPKQAIIFGEIRYCQKVDSHFIAGIRIKDVFYPQALEIGHIHAGQLDRYLAGKGLTTPEVLTVREHLRHCRHCRAHLAEPGDTL